MPTTKPTAPTLPDDPLSAAFIEFMEVERRSSPRTLDIYDHALSEFRQRHKGFTKWDEATEKRVVDFTRLDEILCGPSSIYKKKLNYHTSDQLSRIIVQFENMLKGYLK